jgi:heterodisulfide reductase subunit A
MNEVSRIRTDAVIIGGGVGGLWSAWELARLGLTVCIAEQAPYLGGHVANLSCRATDRCQRCGICLLEDVLDKVKSVDGITPMVRATTDRVDRTDRGFESLITRRPARIDRLRCDNCGKCLEVCPAPGALTRVPKKLEPELNEAACLHFTDGSCRACVDVCPQHAIDLDAESEELLVEAPVIISAGGFQTFDPGKKGRFGYGRIAGVVTAREIDSVLRRGDFQMGEDGDDAYSVAFVQCVGSRDVRIGRNYCSRVCCGYALRMARYLTYRFPGIHATIFYMDIQTFERHFPSRLDEIKKVVRFVRAMPAEIRSNADGRPEVVYQGPDDSRNTEVFDLVVLSVGLSRYPSIGPLSRLARVGAEADEEAFLVHDGEATLQIADGIFAVGSGSIDETVSQAIRTAGEVRRYLKHL